MRYICLRIDSIKIPVWPVTVSGIQIRNREVSLVNDIVVGEHYASNTGQKDRVT